MYLCVCAYTSLSPSVLVESMAGCLRRRDNTRPADILALVASGAKELARPTDKAVNTTAENVLQSNNYNYVILQSLLVTDVGHHHNTPLSS